MSLNLAVAFVGGNLVRNPETKSLPSGATATDFAIAVNRSYKKAGGERVDKTSFFNCVAFGKTGEFVSQYFTKGDPIFVEAEPEQETWEDKDGVKRSAVKFKVKEVKFVSGKNDAPKVKKPTAQNDEQPASLEDDQSIPF